jgi:alkylated DNA repair dioxygenase AlkB
MPDNFEGFPVKEKAGVKNGAQIINGTLYIDKTRLSNEYSKKLYLRDNTDAAGYTKQGLRGFGNVEKLFPNESTYFKYVFERELQRNLYSMKSLETNKDYLKINSIIKDPAQSYEAYINQRALINAFNRETIMTLDGQSYTDMVLNMVEEFSELKNKYPILTQFTIPKVKTGERVLSLNDTKSLKDPQLAEIYFQNLEDLGNEDIKKVIDPEDNKRISKLFALLPQMMMYQHGIGYSKYGFTRALPYEGFIGVMQTASEIFINKQLKEDTLAVIFDKLVEPGNKVFKNLLVTPKQYLAPEPSVVKEEDEFMSEEEAAAMLEKMGIKPIGEELTQPSTSVKTEVVIPGVEIKRNAITKEEQLELFNILKPYIEQQGAKTNKATSANVMIGLGLRWDYKSNNPNYKSIEIKNIIVPGSSAKYGYYEVSINGQPLGPINPRIKTLMSKATGIDATDYDGAIINLYTDKTFISAHNDVDEAADAIGYPVLVLNIGGSGNFSVQQTGKYEPTPLNSGDSYVFGINGENRKVMHRTFPSKQDGFLPAITTAIDGETYSEGSYRLSITLRRVKNLEPGMPTVPAKITTQPSTDNLNAPDGLPGIPRTSTDCQ